MNTFNNSLLATPGFPVNAKHLAPPPRSGPRGHSGSTRLHQTATALAIVAMAGAPAAAFAADEGFRLSDNTTMKLGGFIQLDAIYSTSSEGPIPELGRDFYLPSTIPVNGNGSRNYVDFTPRTSRFNLSTVTDLEGHTIKGFIEMDFYGTDGSDQFTGNWAPRLRHAYIEVDDTWIFGQYWSNFMDMGTFPETLDAQASAESIFFARSPQIRYTKMLQKGMLSVSLENPYNSFGNSEDIALAQNTDQSGSLPEATIHYRRTTGFGYWDVAGLVKEVSTDNIARDNNNQFGSDNAIGYGVRFSSLVKLGSRGDALGFSATYGTGLGRYVGLGLAPEGYLKGNGQLETIPYFGVYAYLRHYWNPQWRSNLVVGTFQADNDEIQDPMSTKSASSVHANLLWSPLKPVTFGVEYAYANREVETGDKGHINRLQFTAKYAF